MAMWFHRNVLKATLICNFDFQLVAHDVQASKLASELKTTRYQVLNFLPDPRNSAQVVDQALNAYLSLLNGLIVAPDGSGAPSKLRYSMSFKWTHTLLGTPSPQVQQDAVFDAANIVLNVAIWFMKHASALCANPDISVDDAKEVHTALRSAGGLFQLVQREFLPKLNEKAREGGDLDPRVIHAYLNQTTAEAQEVTVARAVELKHNAALISALAHETAKLFHEADASLGTLDPKIVGQWRKYLQLKENFYMAYACTYCGENLLSQDKCGEAIRSLREAQAYYDRATALCKEYATTKGPAQNIVRPDQYAFFKKLALKFRLTLEKCERENGFIYHQKVPNDPPTLDSKAAYGLASPKDYSLPEFSPLWTPVAYAALDGPRQPSSDRKSSKAAAKVEGDLKSVNEVHVEAGNKDPKTDSGCLIQ